MLGEHEALALMRAGHSPKPGARLSVGDGVAVEVLGREEDFYRVRFAEPVAAVLERCGSVPLPPISHTSRTRRRRALSDRLCAAARCGRRTYGRTSFR